MKKTVFRSTNIVLSLIVLLVAAGVYAAPVSLARLPGLSAVADPVIRFDPPASTAAPGAIFVVNVVVDNVTDLGGYEFTVSFDPGVLHVQTVTLGPLLGSTGRNVAPLGPDINNASGSFTFGGYSFGSTAGANGTGTVAQITLQAMASGNSALTFTRAQLLSTQPAVLGPLTMTPGSVTVSGPTATPTIGRSLIYLPVLRKAIP
jgi:hypothetical protein